MRRLPLMLDVDGAFFHAFSDQSSMISPSQFTASGTTSLELGASEDEGLLDAPGMLEVASEGSLAPGACALMVESHSLGSVAAGPSGSATTAYDVALTLSLTGDFNGDSNVNASDLAMLLGTWGACSDCAADLNHDGAVSAADLALLLGNWD